MEKCLDFRTVGRLLIVRENAQAPTDSDWDAFCRELTRLRPRLKEMRAVVFTDGGGPTSEQRKKLAVAMSGAEIKTAVVTDKGMVRFIVSTIGLFNKTIRTFHTKETGDAFVWLEMTGDDRKVVREILRDLELTVSELRSSVQASASAL